MVLNDPAVTKPADGDAPQPDVAAAIGAGEDEPTRDAVALGARNVSHVSGTICLRSIRSPQSQRNRRCHRAVTARSPLNLAVRKPRAWRSCAVT
jgi:hypothetical protein